jgi:hypothetical protein
VPLLQLDNAVAPVGRLQQLFAQCVGLGEPPCVTQRLRSLKFRCLNAASILVMRSPRSILLLDIVVQRFTLSIYLSTVIESGPDR